MKSISEKEVNILLEQNEEEVQAIINAGGKLTKTIVEEKDKTTTIVKLEPVNGDPICSTVIQTKEGIIGNIENTPVARTTDVNGLNINADNLNINGTIAYHI